MSTGLTSVKSQLRVPGTRTRQGPSPTDWTALATLLEPFFMGGFFTVLAVDLDSNLVRRCFSTDEDSYPCGGSKAMMGTPWAQHVIHDGQYFIAGSAEDMKWAFFDYQTIFELGCTTALNVPVRQGAGVAWTLNLLRGGQNYTEKECEDVSRITAAWIEKLSTH